MPFVLQFFAQNCNHALRASGRATQSSRLHHLEAISYVRKRCVIDAQRQCIFSIATVTAMRQKMVPRETAADFCRATEISNSTASGPTTSILIVRTSWLSRQKAIVRDAESIPGLIPPAKKYSLKYVRIASTALRQMKSPPTHASGIARLTLDLKRNRMETEMHIQPRTNGRSATSSMTRERKDCCVMSSGYIAVMTKPAVDDHSLVNRYAKHRTQQKSTETSWSSEVDLEFYDHADLFSAFLSLCGLGWQSPVTTRQHSDCDFHASRSSITFAG